MELRARGLRKVFADIEALYTYEGMNCLIVGRHLTGISAFN